MRLSNNIFFNKEIYKKGKSTINKKHRLPLICFFVLFMQAFPSFASEWSGSLFSEIRAFKHQSSNDSQHQYYASIGVQPKYQQTWHNGRQIFDFELFTRLNDHDEHRNTLDIRELSWSTAQQDWEFRLGISQVFWGVTESQHLVDIVNQTDTAERFDGEEKLGQPMINFSWIKNWGTLDFFILPYFRERIFPGKNARLALPLPIANDLSEYDSEREERHIDMAIRWSHYIGDWDIGLSHFYGNNREPRLRPQTIAGQVKFVPFYDLIHQTGLDLQATLGNWLWKLEGIYRSGMDDGYFATTAGLEYSFFDIAASGLDIGIVTEFLYDDRGHKASTAFENDTMLGIRLALNDEQSSEALLGAIIDNEGNGTVLSVEANRRIGDDWKMSLNAYLYTNTDNKDLIHTYASEDFVQLELGYYF